MRLFFAWMNLIMRICVKPGRQIIGTGFALYIGTEVVYEESID